MGLVSLVCCATHRILIRNVLFSFSPWKWVAGVEAPPLLHIAMRPGAPRLVPPRQGVVSITLEVIKARHMYVCYCFLGNRRTCQTYAKVVKESCRIIFGEHEMKTTIRKGWSLKYILYKQNKINFKWGKFILNNPIIYLNLSKMALNYLKFLKLN